MRGPEGGLDDAEVASVGGGDLGGAESLGGGDDRGVDGAEGKVAVARGELGDAEPVAGSDGFGDAVAAGEVAEEADLGLGAESELAPGVADTDDVRAAILAFAREHLAVYKVPRSVAVVDELPRLETGKLYKRIPRDRYWGNRDSRVV